MVYVAELEKLNDKALETLKTTQEQDCIVIFTKIHAMIPIAKVIDFNAVRSKMRFFETECSDVKAFYICKLCSEYEDTLSFLTDIDVSDEIKKLFSAPPEKKSKTARKSADSTIRKPRRITSSKYTFPMNAPVTDESTNISDVASESSHHTLEAATPSEPKDPEPVAPPMAATSDENLVIFIKQMAVRTEDLPDYDGTNEDLAKKIAAILNGIDNPGNLLMMLQSNFSEKDARSVYHWIHPNIKKLMELARNL